MNLKKKKVLVVGAGRSGLAAVKRLKALGARVILTDQKEPDQLSGILELGLPDGQLVLGHIPQWHEVEAEVIVLSPGVSPDIITEASELLPHFLVAPGVIDNSLYLAG